jgi:hypothetical protein
MTISYVDIFFIFFFLSFAIFAYNTDITIHLHYTLYIDTVQSGYIYIHALK